ncbi:NAD(P)/FAD-dependent oxidoreductase [Salinispora arenicola]|uniref:NADH dehydrogenase n=1 Tax=Salinispora arenicola TaxID=168697 RepID=A0A542XHR8_SALAC|nr:NAD(P)/FAD-dependent oxidoreductase [Salinispora arenicola]MCN0151604.1 NAD(P)/FAD-dependent oxidoreductase [Salinispora arenicola]NIL40582.1 NAD(P)/FAD-dependent oxidoreductase [Salinispora arenicola]TQL35382.1 NADH dehydrogenase [Salinispora arenicola]GIM84855.1 NADH dehydrogenase [Salinispora arenicola]
MNPKRILVVGAGHVGLYAALRLSKKLGPREAEVVVVDPQPHMTYQPFLPEAAAGSISPRHSVVPLRRELRRCTVLVGAVTKINHAARTALVQPIVGPTREIRYDHVVIAPGSVSRTLPIPGLHERGIGFKTIGEAIYLRNHVLDRLDVAAATPDLELRRRALTFVFVGGGYAGIEALAEMEDMTRDALRYYPELNPEDMRWVLVEATQRVLPEVDRDMGAYTVQQLLGRGMDIRLGTRLESCVDGVVQLSDGDSFPADTIVWTAGVKPSPMLDSTDFPRDERRRITCRPTLQVVDGDRVVAGAWSAGDCAAVPDLTKEPGNYCSPSAQHAVRQANRMADNIVNVIRGQEPVAYQHKHAGSVASLGLYKGVAQVYGIKMRGLPAWFMHRTYHMSRIPSLNRKVRVVADWTLAFFLKREVVALGQLHDPREEFAEASQPVSAR